MPGRGGSRVQARRRACAKCLFTLVTTVAAFVDLGARPDRVTVSRS